MGLKCLHCGSSGVWIVDSDNDTITYGCILCSREATYYRPGHEPLPKIPWSEMPENLPRRGRPPKSTTTPPPVRKRMTAYGRNKEALAFSAASSLDSLRLNAQRLLEQEKEIA